MLSTSAFLLLLTLCGSYDDPPKGNEPKDPTLRAELLKRTKADQDARNAIVNFMKDHGRLDQLSPEKTNEYQKLIHAVEAADKENTAWLKEHIKQKGWPTFSVAGKDGGQAAWLLVQHADLDPKFQRECLDLMTKLPKNEISQKNLAYLTDRVLLAEGKKQLYGTQFQQISGKWQPRPLEDEKNVDKRRAEMGLSMLAEYASQLRKQYDAPKSKPPSK